MFSVKFTEKKEVMKMADYGHYKGHLVKVDWDSQTTRDIDGDAERIVKINSGDGWVWGKASEVER